MPFPWLGVIPAAGQLLGGLFQNRANKNAWKRTVSHEQSVWERDRAYNERYNSPEAQMQRFKDAGLNPNLIYGQGSPGNVMMSGKPQQSESFYPKNMDIVGSFMQGLMFGKELDMKDAQIQNVLAQGALSSMKVGTEGFKMSKADMEQQYLEKAYPQLLDKLQRENRLGEKTFDYQVEARRLQNEKLQSELATMLKQRGLMDEDLKIKKEVLESKDFMNQILEVQKNFMTGKEVGAQQFFQVLMALLVKGIK